MSAEKQTTRKARAKSWRGCVRCIALASLALCGCTSDQKPGKSQNPVPSDAVSGLGSPQNDRQGLVDAEVIRERLTGTNNGLEVRRWTVLDAPDRVMNVLSEHADGAACGQTNIDRLRRNGFRFIRVKAAEIDAVVKELGGATLDRNEWHGQVYDWRSLRDQSIDTHGTAVAIDGRVRRFDRGDFRLLIRSWTVLMEDGPHLHLEVLPQHLLPRANNLRLLIGEKPEDTGEAFATLALDLQLQAGFGYVLVSESPAIDWPQLDEPALMPDGGEEAGDVAAVPKGEGGEVSTPVAPPAVRHKPRVGPGENFGPEAGTPRTLGEILLPSSVAPPTRELLVFVPKIPAELFPPVYESDLSARRPAERENGHQRDRQR